MLPRTRAFGPSHSTNDRHMLWMGRIREDNGNVAVDDEDEDEPRKCGKDKGRKAATAWPRRQWLSAAASRTSC